MNDHSAALSVLIAFLCLAQLALYFVGLLSDLGGLAFYLDPRIGWCALFGNTIQGERVYTLARFIFPACTGAAAFLMRRWGPGLCVYLVLELLLSLPTLVFFALVLKVSMSPAHGFSVGELPLPVISFLGNCAVPFGLGLSVHRNRVLARKANAQER